MLAASTARAEEAAAGALHWRCTQGSGVQHAVSCLPTLDAAAADGVVLPETPARAGPEMRPVAERGRAEVFSAEAWQVPLHAAPTDPARVLALLHSVLCGRQAACRVSYRAGGIDLATAR